MGFFIVKSCLKFVIQYNEIKEDINIETSVVYKSESQNLCKKNPSAYLHNVDHECFCG